MKQKRAKRKEANENQDANKPGSKSTKKATGGLPTLARTAAT